jgi:hypothetical protein
MSDPKERAKINLNEVDDQEVDGLMNFFEEKVVKREYHKGSFAKIDPSQPGWMVKLVTTDEEMRRKIFPILEFFKRHKIDFASMNKSSKNKNYYEIEVFHKEGCVLKSVPKDFCIAIDAMNIFYIEEDEVIEEKPVEAVIDDIRLDIAYMDKFGVVTEDQLLELEMAVVGEETIDVEIEVEEEEVSKE